MSTGGEDMSGLISKKSRGMNVLYAYVKLEVTWSEMRAFFPASDPGVIKSVNRYTEIAALEQQT